MKLMAPRQIVAGELLPNDVITHLGTDYLVAGVATLEEGERSVLVVATLDDAAKPRVLVVDRGKSPCCVLAESCDPTVLGGAIPKWVSDGSLELRLIRRVAVRARREGASEGLPSAGACDLGVYQGPGHREAIVVLDAGGTTHLYVGRRVTEAGLTLLPGGSVVNAGEGA